MAAIDNAIKVIICFVSFFLTTDIGSTPTAKDDCLYFLQSDSTRQNLRSKYLANLREPAGLMIKACKISEKKYPNDVNEIISFRKTLQNQLAKQKELRKEIETGFMKLCRSRVKKKQSPLAFEKYQPAANFIKNATNDQRNWINKGLERLDANLRKTMEREYLRYMIVDAGLGTAMGQPEIASVLEISPKQLDSLWDSQREFKKKMEKGALELGHAELAKIFEILNKKQIRKLERRLGLKQEHFPYFLEEIGIDHLVKELRCDKVFYLQGLEENKELYKGIKGLKKLCESLPPNIRVRYHATEKTPRDSKSIKKIHNVSYGTIVRYGTPINSLDQHTAGKGFGGGEAQQTSTIWSFEPSPEQSRKISGSVYDWIHNFKEAETLEERIEANNTLLDQMGDVMIANQGVRIFRAFFKSSGPVGFFFLPGVKKEYQLSQDQLNRLEAKGKECAEFLLKNRRDTWIEHEIENISKVLSKKQIQQLERMVNLPLKQIVADRYEFCEKINFYPLYKSPEAGEKSLKRLRVTMEDPRLNAIYSTL